MSQLIWERLAALVVLVSLMTWLFSAMRITKGRRAFLWVAPVVALIAMVPIKGVSMAGLVLSISPSLSVGGMVLWGAVLLRRVSGMEPLGGGGAKGLSIMLLAVGLLVYVSEAGGLGFDIYTAGYGFSAWDILLGASALYMFIRGSRLSYVMLACLMAHSVGLMRTSNIFDAIVDGPSFLLALVIVIRHMMPERRGLLYSSRRAGA